MSPLQFAVESYLNW